MRCTFTRSPGAMNRGAQAMSHQTFSTSPHSIVAAAVLGLALTISNACSGGSTPAPAPPAAAGTAAPQAAASAASLQSWNSGRAKDAITGFVARVTTVGGPDFVPVAERVAVFDNDGTLWGEQPVYTQVDVRAGPCESRSRRSTRNGRGDSRFRGVIDGDMKGVDGQRREGPARADGRHSYRHEHRRVRRHRQRMDRRRRSTRRRSGHTRRWSTSPCWRCWPTCARTDSRPTSCPAAASNSCGRGPSGSMASRRSRSSAAAAKLKDPFRPRNACPAAGPRDRSSLTTVPGKPVGIQQQLAAGRSRPSATPMVTSRC